MVSLITNSPALELFGLKLYYYNYKIFANHLAAIWSCDQLFLFLHPGWGATVIGQ